ncbi:MAG TPA: hypothetical protein VIJ14_10870, partial [Rhabdochlamydiaceae bacterium]
MPNGNYLTHDLFPAYGAVSYINVAQSPEGRTIYEYAITSEQHWRARAESIISVRFGWDEDQYPFIPPKNQFQVEVECSFIGKPKPYA